MSFTIQQKLQQRQDALAKANRIRSENAVRRQQLVGMPEQDARLMVACMLETDELGEATGAWPIYRLLVSIPRFGVIRVKAILRFAGVFSGDRKLCQLTVRQRRVIAGCLREPQLVVPHSRLIRLDEEARVG